MMKTRFRTFTSWTRFMLLIACVGPLPSAQADLFLNLAAGIAEPQFDSARATFGWGAEFGTTVTKTWSLGALVRTSELGGSGSSLGNDERANVILAGVGATYAPGGDVQASGAKLGFRAGWLHQRAEGIFFATADDLFVGPAIGYDFVVMDKWGFGPELAVYAVTRGNIAFYPEAVIEFKRQF